MKIKSYKTIIISAVAATELSKNINNVLHEEELEWKIIDIKYFGMEEEQWRPEACLLFESYKDIDLNESH